MERFLQSFSWNPFSFCLSLLPLLFWSPSVLGGACPISLPTDACTVIADPTCQVLQSEACDPVDLADECLLTIRRGFNESGTYCVNITLADAASLALTSTLVSISGGEFLSSAICELLARMTNWWRATMILPNLTAGRKISRAGQQGSASFQEAAQPQQQSTNEYSLHNPTHI